MRRILVLLLCSAFLLSVVGCGTDKTMENPSTEEQSTSDEQNEVTDSAVSVTESIPSESNTEEESALKQDGISRISISIGETTLYADMYDSDLAKEFVALLPQTISMQRVGGGREFYGSLEGSLNYDEMYSQTTFENGEIAYWYSGNGLCLLYNNQVEDPEIDSGIIVLGKITSDFSMLYDLEDHIEVTVELVEE